VTIDQQRLPGQNIHAGEIPEEKWFHGDDLCDCTFQRMGYWTNAHLARTVRVRVCCIWAKLYAQFPELVQEIPAWFDDNEKQYKIEPLPWNSEDEDMPAALWHRQLAVETGLALWQVRQLYADQEPPKKVVPHGR